MVPVPVLGGRRRPARPGGAGGARLPRRRRRRRARGLGAVADRPGDGRRRPGPHARRSGTAPSSCSTPGRRARSTRCPRSSTASGRPGRRSSASTRSSGSPREATSSSPSTAATRRPTSRCARSDGALLARRPRADDVAPGGRAWSRGWTGCPGWSAACSPRPAVRARAPRGCPSPSSRSAASPGWTSPSDEARLRQAYAGAAARHGDAPVQRHVRGAARRDARRLGRGGDLRLGRSTRVGRAPDGRVARFAGLGEIAGDRGGGIGARDVGPRGGGPGGRRPRAGDEPVDAGARPLRAATTPVDVTEALYHGPDRGRAGGGAGAGRGPGGARRRRGGGRAGRRHRRRAARRSRRRSIRRLGLEAEAVPVTLAGGLARGAADLLRAARARRWCGRSRRRPRSRVLHAPPVLGAALLGLDRLAPGDHAAADRLREEIVAWDDGAAVRPGLGPHALVVDQADALDLDRQSTAARRRRRPSPAPRACRGRRPRRSRARRGAPRRARAAIARRTAAASRSPPRTHATPASSARRITGRGRATRGREPGVARGQRQPVRLADGVERDDLGRQREVQRHPPDDPDLLVVLEPEVGALGADQREQDRDDRRDAVEVPGPRGALERPGDRADRDGGVEARAGRPRRPAARTRGRRPPPRRSRGRAPRCAGTS